MRRNEQNCDPRILVLFGAVWLMGCNSQTSNHATMNDLADPAAQQLGFDKLIGTWKSEDGKSVERWTKNGNGEYGCAGFSVKNGDTSWNEHATVYNENDNWIFKNTVKRQNDGKPIKFTSSQLTVNTVQFTNPIMIFLLMSIIHWLMIIH